MTKDEWKIRCAAQYIRRGGLTPEDANAAAQETFDSLDSEFDALVACNPERSANDNMDCWENDEE